MHTESQILEYYASYFNNEERCELDCYVMMIELRKKKRKQNLGTTLTSRIALEGKSHPGRLSVAQGQ